MGREREREREKEEKRMKREKKMVDDPSPSLITQCLLLPPSPLTTLLVPEVNVMSDCVGITSRVKVPRPRRADTCWCVSQLCATIPDGP
jgi:hypothetical protein